MTCESQARENRTEISIGQALEQTGFLVTRGAADGGGEVAEVRLTDLQRHLAACTH